MFKYDLCISVSIQVTAIPRGRGGGLLAYISCISMSAPKSMVFEQLFGLKAGIDFHQYMVFKRTTRGYKRVCLFISKSMIQNNEK